MSLQLSVRVLAADPSVRPVRSCSVNTDSRPDPGLQCQQQAWLRWERFDLSPAGARVCLRARLILEMRRMSLSHTHGPRLLQNSGLVSRAKTTSKVLLRKVAHLLQAFHFMWIKKTFCVCSSRCRDHAGEKWRPAFIEPPHRAERDEPGGRGRT